MPITVSEHAEIYFLVRSMVKIGRSRREVARVLDIRYSAVTKMLLYGYWGIPSSITRGEQCEREAVALRAEGLSTRQIGRVMGITKNAVSGLFHRARQRALPPKARRDRDENVSTIAPARRQPSMPKFSWM